MLATKLARKLLGIAAHPANHAYLGRRCNVCGRRTVFLADDPAEPLIRRCAWCRSTPKYRAIVRVLEEELGLPLRALLDGGGRVFELSTTSPVYRVHRGRAGYCASAHLRDRPFGVELRRGVWNQDVQRLSFDDASFDVVISSETMEHVRLPWTGFAEIARVLKPGGVHCFTIPYRPGRPTTARVDTSGAEDRHTLPPVHHLDPYDRRGALVYTDFGGDLPSLLAARGFDTHERLVLDERSDIRDDDRPVRVFLSRRRAQRGAATGERAAARPAPR
jgi:SAM-dependent methyltransferase